MANKNFVILAIDDDSDVLNALRIILEAGGFKMVEAYSAEEGLKKYKESKPDFILVDLMMEEVDAGLNFVKEVRLLNNKAPIYMLSSVGDSLIQSTSYAELGLDGVLQKPVDNKTLLKIIRTRIKS
jgi:DNA-binding response OmpR family regulator